MQIPSTLLFLLWLTGSAAWGQTAGTADEERKGRHLSIMLCTSCHVVAPDQPYAPTLNPPAPSFQSIAQRAGTSADWLHRFLITTHQPDPYLADFQIQQISAYLLSLRK
jgi:hypothetical protein